MKTDVDFKSGFLEGRDETGRFTVTSFRTGKTYFAQELATEALAANLLVKQLPVLRAA